MTERATLRAVGYYLCRMDARGRAVPVAQRKTWRGICRLADRRTDLFVVTAHVVIDERADDHGTVYYYDANGGEVEMA